jgi:hypothetical protein
MLPAIARNQRLERSGAALPAFGVLTVDRTLSCSSRGVNHEELVAAIMLELRFEGSC